MTCGPEFAIIQQWHFQLLRFPAQVKSDPMTWFHCWNCSAPGPLISPSLFSNPFFENPWRVQPFFTLTDWVLVSSNRIQFLTPPVLLNRIVYHVKQTKIPKSFKCPKQKLPSNSTLFISYFYFPVVTRVVTPGVQICTSVSSRQTTSRYASGHQRH